MHFTIQVNLKDRSRSNLTLYTSFTDAYYIALALSGLESCKTVALFCNFEGKIILFCSWV